MKSYIPILTLFLAGSVFAQIDHELRFDCFDHDETKCNPFAISSPFCPDQGIYKNNWRVSHGSPQLRAFSGNNPSSVAVLKASNTDGVTPKGEGMFIGYNFLANNEYTIELILRTEDPSFFTSISVTANSTNAITAKTNSNVCTEEKVPSISDKQTIISKAPVPFEAGNELGLITITGFTPTKNYSNFWIYAEPEGIGFPTAEFIISHVTITNTTSSIVNNTICCNQSYSQSSADPRLLTGSTPNGGSGSYEYQWQKFDGSGWDDITGATAKSQNYDPPIISQNTSYRRVVTSDSEIGTSNIVNVNVNVEQNSICGRPSYGGIYEYREGFSVGIPDVVISDFEACPSSTYNVNAVPCGSSSSGNCTGFFYSHGSRERPGRTLSDEIITYCASETGNKALRLTSRPVDDFTQVKFYSGVFTNQTFESSKPIIFSYDLFLMPDSKVSFIATNNVTQYNCNGLRDQPPSIDWSQSQLISEVDFSYFNQQISQTKYSSEGFFKFATEVTPNKEYQYLWILFETTKPRPRERVEGFGHAVIDNLFIHYPESFITVDLQHPQALDLPTITLIYNADYLNDNIVVQSGEVLVAGALGPGSTKVKSGRTARFESKQITLRQGFHAEEGASFRAIARSMVSTNPYEPSGPLIDKDYYDRNSTQANSLMEDDIVLENALSVLEVNYSTYTVEDATTKITVDSLSNGVIIHPNPSNGLYTINFEEPATSCKEIRVLNSIGELVVQESSINPLTEKLIDISTKPVGTYYAKFYFPNGEILTIRLQKE